MLLRGLTERSWSVIDQPFAVEAGVLVEDIPSQTGSVETYSIYSHS